MTQLCPHQASHDSIVSGEFPEINLCWKQISLLIFSPLDSSKMTMSVQVFVWLNQVLDRLLTNTRR